MSNNGKADIYSRMSRNRMRLAGAAAVFILVVMGLSAAFIHPLSQVFELEVGFWLPWTMFWLLCLLYILLRYAAGGRWMLKGVKTLPPWKKERRLADALTAVSLACGIDDCVRLFVIPDEDINSFSLSLPDGTFALFATQGMAHKLTMREREAIMAHEIAHMQAGDTTVYTIMIRLAGTRSLKKMVGGLPGKRDSTGTLVASAIPFLAAAAVAFYAIRLAGASAVSPSSPAGFWLALGVAFAVLVAVLPGAVSALLRLMMDRNREYHADMQAVYLTRDPGAVYRAIRLAAEDVRDVILLPACYDALLFHPVVDFSSYRPYRTQPTMSQRMKQLEEAFPALSA